MQWTADTTHNDDNKLTYAIGSQINRLHEFCGTKDGQWFINPGMRKGGKIEFNRWYGMILSVRGDYFRCFLDGVEIFQTKDTRLNIGEIGIGDWETIAHFKNIRVRNPDGEIIWQGLPEIDAKQVSRTIDPMSRAKPVTGRWLHTGGGAVDVERIFLADGSVEQDGITIGSWSLNGSRLTLRWPNSRAPGGAWVDEAQLDADGDHYAGENQRRSDIRGKRVPVGVGVPGAQGEGDRFKSGTTWKGTGGYPNQPGMPPLVDFELSVTERNGRFFRGESRALKGELIREIEGTLEASSIRWDNVKTIVGPPLSLTTTGKISGDTIVFEGEHKNDRGNMVFFHGTMKLVSE